MNYGKTNYRFEFGGDPMGINNIIQAWLSANGFSLVNNFGETYYYYNDAWNGNRCFQYTIEGNAVTIFAWTIGIGKKFIMLDSGALNNMAGDSYKAALQGLFTQINNYSNSGAYTDPGMSQGNSGFQENPYAQGNVQDVAQFTDAFQQEANERNEKLCNIGFWISIVGLILSFLGIMYGVFIYILEIYFACMGLKTAKKGKAIATFIIAGISVLIIIAQLIGA